MKTLLILALMHLSPAHAQTHELKNQVVKIRVTEKGFEPSQIDLKPGTPVTLQITRMTDVTCAKKIQIPSLKIVKDLPLHQKVIIQLGKLEKGQIRFGCMMDLMIDGQITVK